MPPPDASIGNLEILSKFSDACYWKNQSHKESIKRHATDGKTYVDEPLMFATSTSREKIVVQDQLKRKHEDTISFVSVCERRCVWLYFNGRISGTMYSAPDTNGTHTTRDTGAMVLATQGSV